MKKATNQNNRGLLWAFEKSLEDLDFADDIALLAHRFQHIQGKTTDLANYGSQIGLNIITGRSKIMKVNNKIEREVTIGNNEVEEVSEFVYIGSKTTVDGDSTFDVESRIAKAISGNHQPSASIQRSGYSRVTSLESSYMVPSRGR